MKTRKLDLLGHIERMSEKRMTFVVRKELIKPNPFCRIQLILMFLSLTNSFQFVYRVLIIKVKKEVKDSKLVIL